MKKTLTAAALAAVTLLPYAVRAHEHQIFEINGVKYEFGIGSANEPVFVDDKSGVELQISKVGVVSGHEGHHAGENVEGAVTGLEKTLKVELIAGDERKTLDLVPSWAVDGYYNAPFFPTEAVQLSYRVFGTIDTIPVDLMFTCKSVHDMEGAETDTTRTEVSPGVVRIEKRGSFGCPREKTGLGFPTQSSTLLELRESGGNALFAGIGSSVLALMALGLAWRRRS